jgi:hypothetical protein
MADDPRGLVAQAEREAGGGECRGALKALERAYVPAQRPRDIETIQRALALARRIAEEEHAEARDRRKAQRIAGWYETLVWDAEHAPAPELRRPAAGRTGPPSLVWIDTLVVVLDGFVVLELVGGLLVAAAASTANERIAAVAGAIFGAALLLALIAVIRLLQAIERNTGPAGEQTANGS